MDEAVTNSFETCKMPFSLAVPEHYKTLSAKGKRDMRYEYRVLFGEAGNYRERMDAKKLRTHIWNMKVSPEEVRQLGCARGRR